jgi:hypothetical protein
LLCPGCGETGLPDRLPVFSRRSERAVWLFELIFGWVLRIPYNKLFAPHADRFIWRQLSKGVQGNNRPATRIAGVDRCPSGPLAPLTGLPPTINEAICNLANESAREALPRIRKSWREVRFAPAVTGNQGSLRGWISGDELVHTSYFRCGELLDLVCTHIRLTRGFPGGLYSDTTPGRWDVWVQEYKKHVGRTLLNEAP